MKPHPSNARPVNAENTRDLPQRTQEEISRRISLQVYCDRGYLYSVDLNGARCLIGSSPDSQIRLEKFGLRDRHAVVHRVGEALVLSVFPDLSVLVNGKVVKGTVRLKQGDRVDLGYKLWITVDVPVSRKALGRLAPPHAKPLEPALRPRLRGFITAETNKFFSSGKSLLIAITVMLAGITGLFIWLTSGRVGSTEQTKNYQSAPNSQAPAASSVKEGSVAANHNSAKDDGSQNGPSASVPSAASQTAQSPNDNSDAVRAVRVKTDVKRVMRRIGGEDTDPYVNEAVLTDVSRQIKVYADEGVVPKIISTELGDIRSVIPLARRENIEPDLLLLNAMLIKAEGRKFTGMSVAWVAREILPELKNLSIMFNSKGADSCLIVLAIQREVEDGKRPTESLQRLRELVEDPMTERNFKFLFDRGGISRNAYDYVIRFLALAAIAFDPLAYSPGSQPPPF